ncbi:hypothetical protein ACFE04_009817 [Oxalis oulophora]
MGDKGRRESKNVSKQNDSIRSLFMHADALDFLLMTIGSIGTTMEGLASPFGMFVTSKFMNNFGSGLNSSAANKKYALILLCIGCSSCIGGFLEGYCWTRTGERQASRIRERYLRAVLRQDISYFDLHITSSTEVVSSVSNDCLLIQDVLSEKVPNILKKLILFIACYSLGFILIWRLAILALPIGLLVLIPTYVSSKALMGLAKKIWTEYNKATAIAEQAISCVRTVYAFVGEKQTIDEYYSTLQRSVNFGIKMGWVKGLAIGRSVSFGFVNWSILSYYGSKMVMYHGVQGGTVYSVTVASTMGATSLASGLPDLKPIAEACSAAERMNKMINRKPKIDLKEGEILETFRGEIDFKNVEFAYPSRPECKILNGFDLKVPAGKTVALVGSSGSGKSTAISLLQRFYDPAGGQIFLDGVSIDKMQLKWLRSQMGLVSQEPILFATSVKENILFGKEDATMDEIIEAAKASDIHDFISNLPQGYHTQVGERGIQMSGGQKQRIAIARAIIREPRILLLDEATSALDSESERIVQGALDKVSIGRTTIIIAHRLSTIRNADIIAVIQNGVVLELGSHQELIQSKQGLSTAMVHLQQTEKQQIPENEANELLYPEIDATNRRLPMSSGLVISPLVKTPNHSEDNSATNKEFLAPSFGRLLALNFPEWKQGALGCVSAVVHGAINPVCAFAIGTMLSVYFSKDHRVIKERIKIYSLSFFGVALFTLFITTCQHFYFAYVGEYMAKRIRGSMLLKILSFEVGWFDQEENFSSAVCSRLTKDSNAIKSLMSDQICVLIEALSTITIAVVMSLIISWRLGLVMVLLQPPLVMCFHVRRHLLQSMSRKANKAQEESSKLAAEAVSNVKTITVFSSQDRILQLLHNAQQGPRHESIRQSWFAGFALGLFGLLRQCVWALIYWLSAIFISRGYTEIKAFFEVYTILVNMTFVLADAGAMTSDLARASDSIRAFFSILDRSTKVDPEGLQSYRPDHVSGDIEFCMVEFSYPTRPDIKIFKGFSIKFEAGKSIALVGHSGSGKSTIINLIERFYDPLKGLVKIDGRDLRLYHLKSLRKHIGLVSQEPTLFSGTIRANIIYGASGEIDESEMIEAAKLANAHDFISGLTNGYDTWCGDKGTQLSGGQKQRIAIARVILIKPTILLLDEATSALDSESERLVQEALERIMVGKTSVVVAHRLSTIQNCNEIAVLDNGKVVEKGAHSSLLAKGPNGAYYSLVTLLVYGPVTLMGLSSRNNKSEDLEYLSFVTLMAYLNARFVVGWMGCVLPEWLRLWA